MAKKFDLSAYVNPMESKLNTEEIQHIGLERIRCNAGNFYAVESVDELADSIRLSGLLQPLLVVPAEDGDYRLISGHRRFKAIRQLYEESNFTDWDKAPCIVLPDPQNADREQLMLIHANSTGRVLSAAEIQRQGREIREILVRMKEEGVEIPGRLRDVVAEQMQISSSRLARLDAIENKIAVPGIKAAWAKDDLGESVAYEISQLPIEKQYRFLDRVIDDGKAWSDVSIKDVKDFAEGKGGPTKQQIALACEKLGLTGMDEFEMLKELVRRFKIRPRISSLTLCGMKDLARRLKADCHLSASSSSDLGYDGYRYGSNKIGFYGRLLGFEYSVTWAQLAEAVAMAAVEEAGNPSVGCADSSPYTGEPMETPKWKRVYLEEPEEGQTVWLLNPDLPYSAMVARYVEGQYVDPDGDVLDDVTSELMWTPATLPEGVGD